MPAGMTEHAPAVDGMASARATPDEARALAILLAVLVAGTLYRLLALHLAEVDLFFDEAYYWDWSRDLAWGYYSKPPLLAWLIAATTALLGDSETAVKSGALLLYPVTTVLVYALGRRLFDTRTGLAAALVFFTLPAVSLSTLIIATDVVLLCVWTAAMLLFHRAITTDRWADWLAAGAAGGLGLLAKYNFAIFLPCGLLFLAASPAHRHHLRRSKAYAAMGVAVLLFAPHIAWNAANGWPTLRHTAEISKLGGELLHPGHLAEFLGAQFGVFGPVLFGALLAAYWLARRHWSDPRWRFLVCFSAPFLAAIALQALLARAHANWAAPTYIGASVLVAGWLLQRHRRWLVAGVALNIALGVAFYHWQSLAPAAGITLTETTDPYNRVRGWAALAGEVDRLRTGHEDAVLLADSRREMAEMRYYLRPRPEAAAMWHPGGPEPDHYALTMPLRAGDAGPWLLVTHRAEPADILARFARSDYLGEAAVPLYPDLTLRAHVWHLDGFGGYAR